MFIERLAERTGLDCDIVEAELRAEEARCRSQGDGLDLRAVVRSRQNVAAAEQLHPNAGAIGAFVIGNCRMSDTREFELSRLWAP